MSWTPWRPLTPEEVEVAEAIMQKTGLTFERRGDCFWAWRQSGTRQFGHRYVDIRGLLTEKNPKSYALKAYQGGQR